MWAMERATIGRPLGLHSNWFEKLMAGCGKLGKWLVWLMQWQFVVIPAVEQNSRVLASRHTSS
jgi:hypothetical protein